MALLIKNGRVIDPVHNIDETLNILCEDGLIKDVGASLSPKGSDIFEATGFIVAPGFIDMHVHLREPGYERKETIATGLKAAVAGGFTAVACMPNTDPVNGNSSVTRFILEQAKKACLAEVMPIGAISAGSEGKELASFAEMKEAGIVAVSDDGRPVMDSFLMRKALEYAGSLDLPVIDHCEDLSLSGGGVIHEGKASLNLGLPGIPSETEITAISRDISLCRLTGSAIHIAHVSTKGGVDLIRKAKKEGLTVTAEVTPHHLFLTEEDVQASGYSTNYKMNPPLRTKEDRDALIKGLADGTIDVIATDHAPHAIEEKRTDFLSAPFGIIGLQTAIPIIFDYLIHTKKITIKRMVEALSVMPAKILKLKDRGEIKKGFPAHFTLINPRKDFIFKLENNLSLSENSPFFGRKFRGSIASTIVWGRIVYPFND